MSTDRDTALDELAGREDFLRDLFGDSVELHLSVAELGDGAGPAVVRVTSLA